MSNVTVGQISSTPDENGNHALKCPNCGASFLSQIIKDEDSQVLLNITCNGCGHENEPVLFIHQANKQVADQMVKNFALKEIRGALGKNKHIKLKI